MFFENLFFDWYLPFLCALGGFVGFLMCLERMIRLLIERIEAGASVREKTFQTSREK